VVQVIGDVLTRAETHKRMRYSKRGIRVLSDVFRGVFQKNLERVTPRSFKVPEMTSGICLTGWTSVSLRFEGLTRFSQLNKLPSIYVVVPEEGP
jgi:hypothetical protein